jgi:hypothetical protein
MSEQRTAYRTTEHNLNNWRTIWPEEEGKVKRVRAILSGVMCVGPGQDVSQDEGHNYAEMRARAELTLILPELCRNDLLLIRNLARLLATHPPDEQHWQLVGEIKEREYTRLHEQYTHLFEEEGG